MKQAYVRYIIMWILFGTRYDTVEHEPVVYFIGVFDDYELAMTEKQHQIHEATMKPNPREFGASPLTDYFVKQIAINQPYDFQFCLEN